MVQGTLHLEQKPHIYNMVPLGSVSSHSGRRCFELTWDLTLILLDFTLWARPHVPDHLSKEVNALKSTEHLFIYF